MPDSAQKNIIPWNKTTTPPPPPPKKKAYGEMHSRRVQALRTVLQHRSETLHATRRGKIHTETPQTVSLTRWAPGTFNQSRTDDKETALVNQINAGTATETTLGEFSHREGAGWSAYYGLSGARRQIVNILH